MNENKPGRICAPITFAGVFAILALGIGAGTPAAAQQRQAVPAGSGVPLPDSKWVKRCNSSEADSFCEISFGKMVNFRDKEVWVSVAGLFERADRRNLFVFTPFGTALRRGIAYRVDQSETKTAQYSVCLQLLGCQAITGADQGLIDQMKQGNELQIQFVMGNRPPIVTTVTLSGFTAAYDGEPSEIIGTSPNATSDSGAPAGSSAPAAATSSGGKGDAAVQ